MILSLLVLESCAFDEVFLTLVARIGESGHLSMDAVRGATITPAAVLKAVPLAVGKPGS